MATVLVVDDSVSLRSMVTFTLTKQGYDVVEAEDGEDAFNKAKHIVCDLVLTDVNMPKMDGISLCTELRKLESFKFTPILILTTENSQEMKYKGKAAGATGWLVKPFNPETLLSTLKRVVR
ncbi:response regulator [Neptunomonas japonica]|uniref:Two-component system, chemotaxis family, response regulator CheY n=1 Tax=Neptunomonas japonica JAMM 1380 TaxID=1441457 RepID=A0A7R6SXQ0_9GAMM|nr:response regulator [Neptunomonas japonica]BBB31050.1 two-component system, chemotaxis family, response regulator CheY [Neptunomonas japonica JAMM 1380]